MNDEIKKADDAGKLFREKLNQDIEIEPTEEEGLDEIIGEDSEYAEKKRKQRAKLYAKDYINYSIMVPKRAITYMRKFLKYLKVKKPSLWK